MILDSELMFSEGQDPNADANSTNTIDLAAAGFEKGEPVPFFVRIVDAFSGATAVDVWVLSNSTTTLNKGTHDVAMVGSLNPQTLGDEVYGYMPSGLSRYVCLHYDFTGTPANGGIDAGIPASIDQPHKA